MAVHGKGITKFRDFDGESFFAKEVEFTGRETYISSSINIFKYKEDSPKNFKPNIYTYTFNLNLPRQLPSSLNGKYGKIRYYVEISLITEWEYVIYVKKPFTIINLNNLSGRVDLMEKRSEEIKECFGYFSCKTKPLYLKASIPFTGYSTGKTINVTIFIRNYSGFEVSRIVLSLKRQHIFSSKTPDIRTISDKKTIIKTIAEGAKNKCEKKILAEIKINSNLFNTDVTSKICKLTYILQIAARVVGFHKSLKIEFPIVIGNNSLNYENKLRLIN